MYIKNRQPLFWNTDVNKLDPDKDKDFIISRILEFGMLQDIKELLKNYSKEEISHIVENSKELSPKTAIFWVNKLNITNPIQCLLPAYRATHLQLWNG